MSVSNGVVGNLEKGVRQNIGSELFSYGQENLTTQSSRILYEEE